MSAIGVAFAVAGWVLFGVTLLAFIGVLVVGLGLTEHADAAAAVDSDAPPKDIDFDRDPSVAGRVVCRYWSPLRRGLLLAITDSGTADFSHRSTARLSTKSG
jgi:hypothetical protein